jgi:SARP family transcriptional regulator, regulator of embCAB operon
VNRRPMPLRVNLLGPLFASIGQAALEPSAPKQRQVLALLALNAGQAVTVSTLVEELWGDNPPRSYATTLQTYVLHLRKALAAAQPDNPAARQILSTAPFGYVLDKSVCQTDLEEFNRLSRAGRKAANEGDHRLASEWLGRAFRLWRGPALVDVRKGPVLEIETASLEESRLEVLERRIEADLALGRHRDMLGELTLETARSPMNENLVAFLMIALYRSGHVGRSLQAFHRLRFVLKEELGVEPSTRLQRLQAAILSGDPALDSWSVTQPRENLTMIR